jgi:hypothetical protein
MQNQIHKQMALVMATALLLPAGTPAAAEAPHAVVEKVVTVEEMALQNPQQYAKDQFAKFNWTDEQYICLAKLWGKESAWNHLADNPHSTAFGIAQMLGEDSKLPHEQINNGLRYIEHRYDNPCTAWKYWQRHKWY